MRPLTTKQIQILELASVEPAGLRARGRGQTFTASSLVARGLLSVTGAGNLYKPTQAGLDELAALAREVA